VTLFLGLLPVAWLGLVLLNLLLCPRAVQRVNPKGLPKLSVLVPARNEAMSIGPCVESLIGQVYPEFELIVLDDHSTDGTGAVARAASGGAERFRLVRGRPLPEGWLGKSWACQQLAEAARGELLLFLDADTLAEPGLLRRLVATLQRRRADLLSGFARGRAGSLGEALFIALKVIRWIALVPLGLIPQRRWPWLVAATGACLLVRRETYRRVGGHAAIRHALDDGLALARLVKRSRGRILFCNLADAYQWRLYRSPREAWSVLSKSVQLAKGRAVLALALLGALFLLPPILLAWGLVAGWGEGAPIALAAGTIAGGLIGLTGCRFVRLPTWLGLLLPLSVILLLVAVLRSLLWGWGRQGFEWKGRRYA
jgi:hypothetical protein